MRDRPQHAGHRTPGRHGANASLSEEDDTAPPQMFLFDGEPDGPVFGDEMVVEIKTRGPEAFRRWRTLGAERSHPASVAQAAFYTLGAYGEMRDVVIATMDTGNRTWDHERHPRQTAGERPAGGLRMARRACRPPRPERSRTPTPCRSGISRPTHGSAEVLPITWRSACRVRSGS